MILLGTALHHLYTHPHLVKHNMRSLALWAMVIQAGWGTYSTTMSIVMLSQRRQTDEQFEGWWGPLHNSLSNFHFVALRSLLQGQDYTMQSMTNAITSGDYCGIISCYGAYLLYTGIFCPFSS